LAHLHAHLAVLQRLGEIEGRLAGIKQKSGLGNPSRFE
jgi:hypothetical protein